MPAVLKCVTPVDGSTYVERPLADAAAVDAALARARAAQAEWRSLSVDARAPYLTGLVDQMKAHTPEIAEEISWQMGRPIAYSPFEVRGFEERARYMIGIAADALADVDAGPKEGFRRFVRRAPLGVVAVIAPWNYPYLTAVNAIVPALMAGNAV
ncbi:MAG: aldehyde dehydrogenase family protein, partial [Alphaproteobacteria bacterium]